MAQRVQGCPAACNSSHSVSVACPTAWPLLLIRCWTQADNGQCSFTGLFNILQLLQLKAQSPTLLLLLQWRLVGCPLPHPLVVIGGEVKLCVPVVFSALTVDIEDVMAVGSKPGPASPQQLQEPRGGNCCLL